MDRLVMGEQGRFGLLKASQASLNITPAQDGISFSVDTNATYTTATGDDVSMSFTFVDGDGNPNTYEDNTVVFDPNVAVVNNELTIGKNVASIQFSENNGIVTVILSMAEIANGQTEFLRLSRDIWVRNL